ncbi:anaerobic sulfite reductase subunit AsrB [[Clostridium] colinum]|uniref:anaerobic sulfite reductase subunit AsrB n=1 Tax=[Clostridium] colinum TaxID=36835 RepID=UPI002025A939|nr:anaerobic sulfite reductase subunit AsrB [[Clostridium] colinum]
MDNILKPTPCEILDIKKESLLEHTFKVKTDIKVNHGQFLQLSIPKIGEAPISVSAFGDGWLDFTIRAVGKVTDEIFQKKPGDTLFLRGAYGNGWPFEEKFKGKNLVIITGGTGLAPVRSMLNACYEQDLAKSVTLISGFKNEEGIIFREELEKWKNKFNTYYTLDKDKIDGWNVGFVTDFVSKIDYKAFGDDYEVIIVGPPQMMKFTGLAVAKCGVPEDKIWVSFERKMSCAVGKCGHCRIDEVYVCLEGPVFNYTDAKNLID